MSNYLKIFNLGSIVFLLIVIGGSFFLESKLNMVNLNEFSKYLEIGDWSTFLKKYNEYLEIKNCVRFVQFTFIVLSGLTIVRLIQKNLKSGHHRTIK